MKDEELLRFWGKAGTGSVPLHAIGHMIDVGQVASELLSGPAYAALRDHLCAPFGKQSDTALNILPMLAAFHDLGKISPGFQAKRNDLTEPLRRAGFKFPRNPVTDHGRITLETLAELLPGVTGMSRFSARRIAEVLGSHHGTFYPPSLDGIAGTGVGRWNDARIATVTRLAELFNVPLSELSTLENLSNGWLIAFAGLVAVCDWIGSAIELFPYARVHSDLEEYTTDARYRAKRALDSLGFLGWAPFDASRDFTSLFPGNTPYPVQAAALEVSAQLSGPSMVIIEAPMGIGKTEASLAIAEQRIHKYGLSGMYYALPTQATSNQMFGRVREFLEQRYEGLQVDLHLLHQLSDLNERYRELRLAAVDQDSAIGSAQATTRASTWFCARKRGLLASFGVGTIDQSLLGVLTVRHMFVRLFGLTGKVVVFDEVHAYDTYMSKLLDRLVAWLGVLGSSVVVLSATLPRVRRDALLAAYGGAEATRDTRQYPLVSGVSRGGDVASASPSAFPKDDQTIHLVREEPGDSSERTIAKRLQAALRDGGCVAWIRNTVAEAQSAFKLLRHDLGSTDTEVHLLHARFPVHRRIELETDLLERFGKSGVRRPSKAVLVATQVVEQSLDLDFDLMITDLAPVDLMLQRAGRLHRHRRGDGECDRPPGLRCPALHWLVPSGPDDDPDFGISRYVYHPYVLLRTWLVLREVEEIRIPLDVSPLVEQVYGSEEPHVPDGLREAYEAVRADFREKQKEMDEKAREVVLAPPSRPDGFLYDGSRYLEEDKPDLHHTLRAQTRITQPSVILICARSVDGQLQLANGVHFDPDVRPNPFVLRDLRRSSVSIQHRGWVSRFFAMPAPEPWEGVGALVGCRLCVFHDGVHRDAESGQSIRLSESLGIVINSTHKE